MTYDSEITKPQTDALPEFFEITAGIQVERLTSYADPLSFQGYSWTPATIARANLKSDTKFGAISCTVSAILTENIAKYISNQPIEPVRIKIYKALYSDLTDYVVLFNGTIKSVSIEGRMASCYCESKSKILDVVQPKIINQSFCNHDIYDDGCAVDPLTYRVAAVISSVSGDSLISGAFALYSSGYFNGGWIEYQQDLRFVLNHVGSTVTLHIPFDSKVSAGISVYAYPGCDGNPSTCKTRFNNFTHFLGMPYIPSHNPVAWGFK